MTPLARFSQQEQCPTRYHFSAVTYKGLNDFFEVKHLRLAVNQGDHIDAHHRLKLCLRVQVIEHNITDFATTKLNHHAQAVLVGLIAKLGNSLDLFLFHQLGNTLQ